MNIKYRISAVTLVFIITGCKSSQINRLPSQKTVFENTEQTKPTNNTLLLLELLGSRPNIQIAEATKLAKNDLPKVRTLVANGANINAADANGYTPLYLASSAGLEDTVKLLLAKGANVNIRTPDGWTPLMIVSESGNLAIATTLISKGADVNAENDDKWTALRIAARWSNQDIFQLLQKHGAKDSFLP